jgi:hypothetical protein
MLFDPGNDIFVSTIRPDQFETTPAIVKAMFDLLVELPRFSGHMEACGLWGTSMQGFVPVG